MKSASCELQIKSASCELQIKSASYELRVASYELRNSWKVTRNSQLALLICNSHF